MRYCEQPLLLSRRSLFYHKTGGANKWDNARIAEELGIAAGTVKNHVTSIYVKSNVRSRAEAVAWAWEHGVVGV